MKLRHRIILTSSILLLSTVGATVYLIDKRVRTTTVLALELDVVRSQVLLSNLIESDLQSRYHAVNVAAQSSTIQSLLSIESLDQETAHATLLELLQSIHCDRLLLYDRSRKLIDRIDISSGIALKELTDEQDVAGGSIVEPRIVTAYDGKLYFRIAVPIIAEERTAGYLVAGFQITQTTVDHLSESTGAIIGLVGDNVALYSSTISPIKDALLKDGDRSTVGEAQQGAHRIYNKTVSLIASRLPLREESPGTAPYVTIAYDLNEKLGDYRILRTELFLIGAIGFLISLFTANILARSLSHPVQRLIQAINRLAKGEHDATIPVKGPLEVKELARAFNQMLLDLKQSVVSRDYVQNIIDTLTSSVLVLDPTGTIEQTNPACEVLLGYSAEELKKISLNSLIIPSPGSDAAALTDELFCPSRIHAGLHYSGVSRSGKHIPLHLSVACLQDAHGTKVGYVLNAHDITLQIENETMLRNAIASADEANKAKDLFLANMSHEIRTPLGGVMGLIDIVLDTSLQKEQIKHLTMARTSAASLLTILNDILDVSKIAAAKLEIESIPFSLKETADLATNPFIHTNVKNLSFVCAIDPEVPRTLLGDPVRIRQVLINLIGNAVKFTAAGEIELSIKRLRSQEKNSAHAVIHFCVRDTGIGIPPQAIAKIFKAFQQADGSTTRLYGGTGLGLSIARQLVGLMGGELQVTSAEGVGSSFFFALTLPIGIDEFATAASAGAEDGGSAATPTLPLSILVAEDNSVNQLIIAKLLRKWGHGVTLAENGQEAIQRFQEQAFDIILMDVNMPLVDGFQATKTIRQQPGGAHIPIIALTAASMKGDEERCQEAGMNGYLTKPLDRSKLEDTLNRYGKLQRGGRQYCIMRLSGLC